MSTRIVFAALLSAALLNSCGPLHPGVRPEVAQPGNEALRLSGYWTPNKTAIIAKLNQAASVPNLNSDEQERIRATAADALWRAKAAGLSTPRTSPTAMDNVRPSPTGARQQP
jgi:hypothetical protein